MSAEIQSSDGMIRIAGELDFVSSQRLATELRSWPASGDIHVDLSAVVQSNSAGLAFLLEWMKIAQQKSRQIKYHNVPEQLLVIARAYGIDEQLPLA